jgi:hypothetical protein
VRVIEPDHRQIAGNLERKFKRLAHYTDCGHVVRTNHRRRANRGNRERCHGFHPRFHGVISLDEKFRRHRYANFVHTSQSVLLPKSQDGHTINAQFDHAAGGHFKPTGHCQ